MRIILRQAAHAGQAVHHAGLLVAVDRAELEQAQRQLAVGALTGTEDQVVHRAVHRLQVVVEALLDDVAVLVLFLVDAHRRVHAVLVPLQMAGDLIEMALGDVRGLHEAVVVLAVHLARVVLHGVDDRRALGMEHGQTRAQLLREGEQVHLLAQLAVVALGGLLHALHVGLQVVLAGPCGAVDALQHRVLLGAAPVGGGHALQLEGLDEAGVRQVRAAAQVLPDGVALAVHVVVHAQLGLADLGGGLGVERGLLVSDQFELVRLVGLLGAGLLFGDRAAAERLRGLDDPLHALLDLLEILRGERILDVEVVVEAVLDDRTDAQLGVRADLLDRLGHDMRGRMAHDGQTILAVEGDRFDHVAVVQRRVQVAGFAVQTHGDDVLVLGEQFGSGEACIHLLPFVVDRDGDGLFSHGMSFAIGVRGTNVQTWTVVLTAHTIGGACDKACPGAAGRAPTSCWYGSVR